MATKSRYVDSNRIVRVVSILLVVAIVLGFGVWFALQNGLRQKYTKAFTVRYDAEATDTGDRSSRSSSN